MFKNLFCVFSLSNAIGFFLIFSCSPSKLVLDTNDIVPTKKIDNKDSYTFLVKDERKTDLNIIPDSFGRKLYLNIPVAEYVQEYFNKSTAKRNINSDSTFILVIIDQLKFESGNSAKYSFRFSIPLKTDSVMIFRIASKFTGQIGTTQQYLDLLNAALTECLESFFDGGMNITNKLIVESSNSQKLFSANSNSYRGNDNRPDTTINDPYFKEDQTKELEVKNYYTPSRKIGCVNLSVFVGDKINGGGQIAYNFGSINTQSDFIFSYGFGLEYYSVLNKRDAIEGFLLSGIFPLSIFYFTSDYKSGLYLGMTAKLISGNEKIDYGYFEETHFYFGPTIEPFVGVKLAKAFSLDAGFYALKLFGSKILPDDTGFRFSLNLWL